MSDVETSTVTKICKHCNEEKLTSEFYIKKGSKDGYNYYCKKCDSDRIKIYADKNKERNSILRKIWYEANKERVAERNKRRYEENKEHMVAVRKVWRDANPEKNNAYRKAWRKANPEKSAVHSRNRLAKHKESIGTHTAEDVQNLFALQRKKCAVCSTSIIKGYHVDHIVALVNGGSNDKYNLQLLCAHCNCTKRSKDPIYFMNQNGRLL